MPAHSRTILATALLLGALSQAAAQPGFGTRFERDDALRDFVLTHDPVLSHAIAACPGLHIARGTGMSDAGDPAHQTRIRNFRMHGLCPIRPGNLADDDDCRLYNVRARGTIDTPSRATVRAIDLSLVCTREGR